MKRATVAAVDGIAGHDISIHALVKRATTLFRYWDIRKNISIHALVKRATTAQFRIPLQDIFQSTPS